VAPLCKVPELLPPISTVLPSPVHQFVNPAGGLTHCGVETLSVVLPFTEPSVAVMVVLPAVRAVASPEFEMVATEGVPEDHVTRLVVLSAVPLL